MAHECKNEVLENDTVIADQMRKDGFAVRWRNYTVEQLIEKGYLKLDKGTI